MDAGNLEPQQKIGVKMIYEAGYRMLSMINTSLDLFKMEQGTYNPHLVDVDVTTLISKVLSELSDLVTSKKLTISVFRNGASTVGKEAPFIILGEELLCYSMLANILKNAFEASPERGEVRISLCDVNTTKTIQITNSGTPPLTVRGRFFEKYATAGKRGGTGLGTYSSMRIARTLGGDISMECSDETSLTSIKITLPARDHVHVESAS